MFYGVAMLKTLQNYSEDPKYKELDTETFEEALLLHDIGKLLIPDEILLKRQRLQNDEYKIMIKHPEYGEYFLKSQNKGFNELSTKDRDLILEVVKYHHERIDGTGYPYGLSDSEIPTSAKICQIADVYDAITSDRPYHIGRQVKDALKEIEKSSGTQLDKEIVTILIHNNDWKNAAIPYKQSF